MMRNYEKIMCISSANRRQIRAGIIGIKVAISKNLFFKFYRSGSMNGKDILNSHSYSKSENRPDIKLVMLLNQNYIIMKTVLLTLVALTIAHLSHSQINKGALLLEGGLSFSQSEYTDDFNSSAISNLYEVKMTQFSLSPRIGYFVNETFLIGIGAGYSFSGTKSESSDSLRLANDRSTNIFSISPYVRKYIVLSDKFYLDVTGRLSAGMGWTKYDMNSDRTEDVFKVGVDIIPGFTYFVNPKWAVTANFGRIYYDYSQRKSESTDFNSTSKNSDNQYGVSFALNTFGLGVQYFLRNE